jgi:hypothetical protein
MKKRSTLEIAANSYSAYNINDTYRAFLAGAEFVRGGELMSNIWHFKGDPKHEIGAQIVGLFLLGPLTFDIRVVEPEDVPSLRRNDLIAWAKLSDLIPFEGMTGVKPK